MSNRVMHFEIPSADTQRLREFFNGVFGWTFTESGDHDYWLAHSGEDHEPGINGAIMKKVAEGQPVINTIEVSDLDSIASAIELQGGKIVKPKFSVPGVGWLLFFADPDNNMHGAMQMDATAI
jgi:hypothetical protein